MSDIEQKALQTFQNNLLYLQKEHPETYKKIDILNTAIQSGRYKENFALEYKDGYFDVLDLTTQEWLYGESSTEKAKEMAKDINFKKSDGVIETFYNYSFNDRAIEAISQEDPSISQFVLTAPIIGFTTKLIDKNTTMKKIYKFIFFGVGLGLHLESIHEKIDAYMYLIIEDNLEIFRLSLFVTDFSIIGKETELYFCIMSNETEFKNIFDIFYHNSIIRNGYLKYSLFYQNYREKIARVQTFIVSQSSNTYLHDLLLKKNAKVINSIEQKYKYFDVSKHYKNTIFSKIPVILVAAGPSLGKNIEWLKKNAPHSIVIALFMVLPILEEHQIKPDIIIHIDEDIGPIKNTLEKIKNPEFFSSSIFFFAPSIPLELVDGLSKKEFTFLFEDRTRYRYKKGHLESFSVGEIMYALSLLYDASEIYLLGLDLALDFETKKTHSDGHDSANSKLELQKTSSSDTVSLRESEFYIKGNFREKVPTTPLFDMSRHVFDKFTKNLKQPYQNVYNLNDGAYFEETIPTKSTNADLSIHEKLDFHTLQKKLLLFFDKHASNEMDTEEKTALESRLKEAKDKKKRIISVFKQKYPSIEKLQTAFVNIAGELITPTSEEIDELAQIYIIYLENIGSYIGDFLNTKEIDNPKREIKKFQKIISIQFLKLVDKYIEILEKSKLLQD